MKIACLQFAPQVGDVDNNLNRADSVLSKANPDEIDLLVLPELAFSGYNFKSLQDIAPFLEHSGSGITSLWARTIALKYNCTVTVGYPEKVDVSPKWPTGPEYYNSAIVVNGDGETIANYRKNFLYYTDETWALEGGRGFYEGFIPGLGNTSIGICMDINPYRFEAPWNAFEFACHILEMESNLVIVSMAWMTREEPRNFTRMPNEPDMETLTYWVTRLEPLIRSDNQDEIIVVFCNRSGNEDDALYAGTSAVVGIHDGEVKVYGLLGRGEKDLLVVDTNNPPYAKLVYRPDADGPGMEAPGILQKEGDPDNSENKQHSSNVSSKQNFLPPSPPLPVPSLSKQPAGDSLRRHHPPDITIPREPDLVTSNSARTPGTDSLNIPTPSAPSPTPMAVRPRLFIPESPPILPHQYPPDHPISAASLRSERSIQSVKSYTSIGSTQTIRSNPRPPEESTPYPSTATPLSGYPSNFFTEDKTIYGGDVTFEAGQGAFDPDTPFDDMSPVSPPWFWRPSDSRTQTPHSAETWTPGASMWRRPEPFPWPAITSNSRPHSRSSFKNRTNDSLTQDLQNLNSKSPQPNDLSNRTNTNKTTQSESSVTSKRTVEADVNERSFARPPSTKSRNASRSGMDERSNSALGDRDSSTAISQHLEDISRRAESVNKLRDEAINGSPCPDRPPSPKSRNCSRGRPDEDAESQQDHHLIHIAASPSLLKSEGRNPYRQMPRANHHQRSNSSTNGTRAPNFGNNERSGTPNSVSNMARPASRAASRGRTPGPKVSSINGISDSVLSTIERASSVDSTRNDLLHSRIQGQQSQSRQFQSRMTSSTRNPRRPSQGGDPVEFERVEAILCPSCPVHGRHSSSDHTRPSEGHLTQSQSSPRAASTNNAVTDTDRFQDDDAPRHTQQGQPGRGNSHAEKHTDSHASLQPDLLLSNEGAETSGYSSSGTLQTISSPGRSPATPFCFEPATPKAMVLETDDTDIEPLPNGQLDSYEKTPVTRCAESEPLYTFDLPVGSVMS
ncbi:hypothetical protein BGZ61DRAFT_441879 [Ilyonectria robusta]|uniref:uncharacterized protein n=1 Tax=Ilyonectria robusta TaxID=1079257 RepID=UPI001E8EBB81|nr:uncharacterized protein BGZ61DRAFT_441879 [Ilyonectria robusta]KAH8736354.1 hypothetical protein BGZ61DRAFT_441879 [Ilyonectria robusta]